MYLSNAGIELLRLVGWCKNLPTGMHLRYHSQVLEPSEVKTLEELRLVNITKNGNSIRLRPRGLRLLRYLSFDYPQDAKYVTEYGRRLEASEILLAFYRAGCNVFVEDTASLGASQVFLPNMAVRRNKALAGDLFSGEKFAGIACVRNRAALCHYVTGQEEGAGMYYSRERKTLSSIAARFDYEPAMYYAGVSYLEAARALKNVAKDPRNDFLTYAQVCERTAWPLHLLECSDAGALQLHITAQEQYRKRLTVALGAGPPPAGISDADASIAPKDGHAWPLLLAVDMDVKRIDRALRQTVKAGCPQMIVVCLEQQAAALDYIYGKTGKVHIKPLNDTILAEAFGKLLLYEPEAAAYISAKGVMLDASNLPVD